MSEGRISIQGVRAFVWVVCSGQASFPSFRFVIVCIVIVFRQTWGPFQTVKRESESYSDLEIGLTAEVFGGDFDLVPTNSFPENCEPTLQAPRGHANVGFRSRTLTAAKRCRFESRFLSERAGRAGATRACLRNTRLSFSNQFIISVNYE